MLIALLPLALASHGGMYRPPLPTPPMDGRLPRTAVPGAPGTPGPGQPVTPAGSAPAAPGPGQPGTPASVRIEIEDLSWRHWWGLSSDRWIDVKAHVHGVGPVTASDDFYLGRGTNKMLPGDLRPTPEEVDSALIPALVLELESRSGERVTAALLALGKIGPRQMDAAMVVQRFERHLRDAQQEIAESATLALGLSGLPEAEGTLLDLALDRSRGRTLVGRKKVPTRTRAFAAYGLGLLGHANEDLALRQRIAEAMIGLVEDDATATHDLPVAAISAFGLVPLGDAPLVPRLDSGRRPGPNAVHSLSLRTQLEWLRERVVPERERSAGALPWQVRAHGVRTLARMASMAPEAVQANVIEALTRTLRRRSEPESVHQSVALALGSLVDVDDDPADAKAREALVRALDGGQPQVRRFALISMARIGARAGTGEEPDVGLSQVRETLLTTLARGKSQLRPWAGLALGVLGRELVRSGVPPDAEASRAVRNALRQSKAPESVGAYALAVGLRKDLEALSILEDKFERIDDPLAKGDLALALGLMGEVKAAPALRSLLPDSRYQPALLHRLAVGLAMLRDREVVSELVGILRGSRSLASRAAVAAALGAAGDRRALAPLLAVLEDDEATEGARAFAAAALGGLADRHPLPWYVPYAEDVNVRLLMPTQADGTTGLFDIL